jgi:hypothetical protein
LGSAGSAPPSSAAPTAAPPIAARRRCRRPRGQVVHGRAERECLDHGPVR